MEFDIAARTVAWGYSDVEKLYHDASSQENLKYIDVPFMILSAHDDPIAQGRHIPSQSILSNTNGLLIESKYGGHCNFLTTTGEKRWFGR